jgi:hypothetical protein
LGLREQNRSKLRRNRSDYLRFAATETLETGRCWSEGEPIDLQAQVVGNEMPVCLGREARVGVAEDPLHRRDVGSAHEQERGRRVAKVVEADWANLAQDDAGSQQTTFVVDSALVSTTLVVVVTEQLTYLQLSVMKALWQIREGTVGDVLSALATDERELAPTTAHVHRGQRVEEVARPQGTLT